MVAEKAADLIRGREPLAPFWSGERGKGKASKTNENLNAPTIMVAEKAADLIRGREPLASFWSGERGKGRRAKAIVNGSRGSERESGDTSTPVANASKGRRAKAIVNGSGGSR